jgi:hypothetical protein
MARMKRSSWIIAGAVAAVVAVLAWVLLRPRPERVTIDLIDQFPNAVEKRPTPDVFSIVNATLAGQEKRAIFVKVSSRIAWKVTVPRNAWLDVSAGLLEDGWTTPGDGVLFRVSANDDELLNVDINPYGNPADRRWQDFMLDLSEYAGETVNIFLKTNAGTPGHNDTNGDLAVWGEPRIVQH